MTTTPTAFEAAIERLHRVTFWTKGYRVLVRCGLSPTIHTADTRLAQLPGGAYAYLDITDVEWLLTVAATAQAAADEARDEMSKGMAGSFREDFPATAKLIDLFEDGEGS